MSTKELVKSAFVYGYKPTPAHDYIGQSDDNRCMIYRDRKNGEDYSLCVEKDTYENWHALWQLKVANKLPQPNYHATAQDFLNEERAFGTSFLELSPEESDARAYTRLARLAKMKDEGSGYSAGTTDNLPPSSHGALLGVAVMVVVAASTCLWLLKSIFLGDIETKLETLQASVNDLSEKTDSFTCKTGQEEVLHTCKDMSALICEGALICVKCDNSEFKCEHIERAVSPKKTAK